MNKTKNRNNYVFKGNAISAAKPNKPKRSAFRKAIVPAAIVAAIAALLVILFNTGLYGWDLTVDLYPTPTWIVDGGGIFGKTSNTFTGDMFRIIVDGGGNGIGGLHIKATDTATGEVLLNWKPSNDNNSVQIAAVGNEVKFEVTTFGFTGMFEITADDFSGHFLIHEEY